MDVSTQCWKLGVANLNGSHGGLKAWTAQGTSIVQRLSFQLRAEEKEKEHMQPEALTICLESANIHSHCYRFQTPNNNTVVREQHITEENIRPLIVEKNKQSDNKVTNYGEVFQQNVGKTVWAEMQ